jgi:hypothetical protein
MAVDVVVEFRHQPETTYEEAMAVRGAVESDVERMTFQKVRVHSAGTAFGETFVSDLAIEAPGTHEAIKVVSTVVVSLLGRGYKVSSPLGKLIHRDRVQMDLDLEPGDAAVYVVAQVGV